LSTDAHQSGLIVIWNDIVPECRDNFLEWHSREHIPERVAIPGFLRGQRWFGESASPQYLTIYSTADASVLTSAAYLARLNSPTPWTQRSVADFRNTSRAAGSLVWGSSGATGGVILSARFDIASDRAAALAQQWASGPLASLAQKPGIARVRVAVSAASASQLQTAERAVRSGDIKEPSLIVLVEGFDDIQSVQGAFASVNLTPDTPVAARLDCYQLQFDLASPQPAAS